MNSNRGSISIYMAIVLPTLVISMFVIIIKLNAIQMQQATITSLTQVSEVQMTQYKIALYDDYRLLAYKENDEISTLFDLLKVENKLPASVAIDMTPHKLSNPSTYTSAVISAAKAEGVDELVSMGVTWLDDYLKAKDKGGIGKQVGSAKEKVYDKLNAKEISSNLKTISKKPSIGKLKQTIQKIDESEKKVKEEIENYKTLKASYKALYEEDPFENLTTYLNEMEELSSSLKHLENELAAIDERLDRKKEEKHKLQDRYDNLVLGGLDTGHVKANLKEVRRDIRALEDLYDEKEEDIKPIVSGFLEDHFGEQPSWLERLEKLKLLAKEKWDEKIDKTLNNVDEKYLSEEIEKLNKSDFKDQSQSMIEKGLIVEYCLGIFKSNDPGTVRNFDFTGQKKDRKSLYASEVEYILSTHRNDKLNSGIVKGQMLALREPVNLFIILSSPQIMGDIAKVTAILPTPWKFVADAAIVGSWSVIESYLDVQALSEGEGVKLIKTYKDLHLTLNNLMDDGLETLEDNIKKETPLKADSKDVLYYQDYLRILLYMQDVDQTLSKMMKLTALSLNTNEEMLVELSTGHHVTLTQKGKVILELERDYGQ